MQTLKDYQDMYRAETSAATSGDYVVREDIWIAMAWSSNNNWEPGQPGAQKALERLCLQQPDLGQVVCSGLEKCLAGLSDPHTIVQ